MIVFPYNSLLNMVMPCMQCHLDPHMFTIQSHSLLAGDHWESFTSDSLVYAYSLSNEGVFRSTILSLVLVNERFLSP